MLKKGLPGNKWIIPYHLKYKILNKNVSEEKKLIGKFFNHHVSTEQHQKVLMHKYVTFKSYH